MNKIVKITLLCLAVLISFGAVIVFAKTQLEPPTGELSLEQVKEECKNALKKDLAIAEGSNSILTIDSVYHVLGAATKFMLADSLIKANEHDELLVKVTDKYVPKFIEQSNGKFAQHSWHDDDLNFMRSRCAELNGLKKADNTALLSSDSRVKLSQITNVLDLYSRARAAAGVSTSFTSLNDAKNKIHAAREYATKQPLCNNTDLVSRLNSVASRLEQSHYNSLVAKVEKARTCSNFRTEDAFEEHINATERSINEYANNANSVYGHKSNTSSLFERLNRYNRDADCWGYDFEDYY